MDEIGLQRTKNFCRPFEELKGKISLVDVINPNLFKFQTYNVNKILYIYTYIYIDSYFDCQKLVLYFI